MFRLGYFQGMVEGAILRPHHNIILLLPFHFRSFPTTTGVPAVLLHSKNEPSYITTS